VGQPEGRCIGLDAALLRRFVNLADWAQCRFALRVPRDIFGKAELNPFGMKRSLTIDAADAHWIVDWWLEDSENHDRFAEDDGRGWMGRLMPQTQLSRTVQNSANWGGTDGNNPC
jgi:hypothetical protein